MHVAKFVLAVIGVGVIGLFFALPACGCSTKAPAYYATIKADLRNLQYAQETFEADSQRLARSLEELGDARFAASSGVVLTLASLSDTSWQGVARHEHLDAVCRLTGYAGTALVSDPSVDEPVCVPPYRRKRTRLF